MFLLPLAIPDCGNTEYDNAFSKYIDTSPTNPSGTSLKWLSASQIASP